MFKALCLVALAFGVASAQRWPMITVNAAGDIVLQSTTRAASFQVTVQSVNALPLTGATGLSAAAPLPAGSAFDITAVASLPAAGVALPATVQGTKISLYQRAASPSQYTIYAPTGSSIAIAGAVAAASIAVTRRTECTAVSTILWHCAEDSTFGVAPSTTTTTTTTTNVVLGSTAAQTGGPILASATVATGTVSAIDLKGTAIATTTNAAVFIDGSHPATTGTAVHGVHIKGTSGATTAFGVNIEGTTRLAGAVTIRTQSITLSTAVAGVAGPIAALCIDPVTGRLGYFGIQVVTGTPAVTQITGAAAATCTLITPA